jgi:prepilin-type N-terminal cleavage/methylation domain-containing protein
MNRWWRRSMAAGEKGVTLIETITALALLGIFGAVFFSAMASSSELKASIEDKVNVDTLARTQMEYTKNVNKCPYDAVPPYDYTTIDQLSPGDPYAITLPEGYSISVNAAALHNPDDGIQEITVSIYRDGENHLTIKGFKVDR